MRNFLFAVTISFSNGCSKSTEQENIHRDVPSATPETMQSLQYRFRDSSVPPPSHRSRTLTLRRGGAHKVVDSYGDVISDEKRKLTAADWETVIRQFREADFKNTKKSTAPMCAGGTGHEVTAMAGTTVLFKGSWESCGGKITGDQGDVMTFITSLEKVWENAQKSTTAIKTGE